MIREGKLVCPNCGGVVTYYDTVKRPALTKGRVVKPAYIRRLRCVMCRKLHRELPSYIFPYKRYEAELIQGVLEGLITSDTMGYEDYPCSATMRSWILQHSQGRL